MQKWFSSSKAGDDAQQQLMTAASSPPLLAGDTVRSCSTEDLRACCPAPPSAIDEDNKKKSELGKRNKGGIVLDGVAQSTHTTRSTLHPKVVIQQEEQVCPRPFYFELSKRTHTKKHDVQTFIVEKDKQIHEQVELQRGILTQNGEDIDESQLYYDVVGRHDKKRRVYELDSKSQQSDNANSSKMQDDI
nr:uncharacterized protein LOC109173928 [Ipomoea batatas]